MGLHLIIVATVRTLNITLTSFIGDGTLTDSELNYGNNAMLLMYSKPYRNMILH